MRRGLGAPGECGVRGKEPRWKDEVHLTAGLVCMCVCACVCDTLRGGGTQHSEAPVRRSAGPWGTTRRVGWLTQGKGRAQGREKRRKVGGAGPHRVWRPDKEAGLCLKRNGEVWKVNRLF